MCYYFIMLYIITISNINYSMCPLVSTRLRSFSRSEKSSVQFSSVTQSCPTLRPHGLQHARLPCPSPTPGETQAHVRWVSNATQPSHTLSSVIAFSSCLQSFPASGSSQMSQLFAWGGQSIGVSASASVLPMNIQDWSLGWTGWIFLQF